MNPDEKTKHQLAIERLLADSDDIDDSSFGTAGTTLAMAVSLLTNAPEFEIDVETDEAIVAAVRAAAKYAAYCFDEMLKWEEEYDRKQAEMAEVELDRQEASL